MQLHVILNKSIKSGKLAYQTTYLKFIENLPKNAKRLHSSHFMAEKGYDFAVRCNINQPLVENLKIKTTSGRQVSYRLLSISVYMTERIHDLIDQAQK